jgi:anti-anti-sigma factor
VQLSGQIVRENQLELRNVLESLGGPNVRAVALDLNALDYIDSSGLGTCAAARKSLREKGVTRMVAFGASPSVQKMWRLIRLDLVIPCLATEKEALAQLRPAAPVSAG